MLIIFFFLTAVTFYTLLAMVLKLPTFKASGVMFKNQKRKKQSTISSLLDLFAQSLAKYIPMGMLKNSELERTLKSANIRLSPKEYTARAIVHSAIFLPFAIGLLFLNRFLAIVPFAFCIMTFHKSYTSAGKCSDKRKLEIEKELPRFVSYMSNSLKSNRNLIAMIDVYKSNYYTILTEELSITVADMRTGNQERALQRLEARINSPLLSELIRGMLSALRGNDMTIYFENLNYKLSAVWQQRLKEQALKKEPKVTLMSYLLFASALVTIFVILGAVLSSAMAMMGG